MIAWHLLLLAVGEIAAGAAYLIMDAAVWADNTLSRAADWLTGWED